MIVSEDFLRTNMYISADIELRKLWQVPKKRAERNLSDDLPSIDWNGTDTAITM